jgi:hypothetical protein
MVAFLDQLEQTLSGVEQHVDELFTSQPHLAPVDADVQRCERPYQLAGTIDHRLEQVSESLQTTLGQLTSARDRLLRFSINIKMDWCDWERPPENWNWMSNMWDNNLLHRGRFN